MCYRVLLNVLEVFFLLKYQIYDLMKNHTGFCDCTAVAYLSAFFFQDNLEASKSRHSSLHILKWVSNSFSHFISASFNIVKDPSANSENRVSFPLHGILPDKTVLQGVLNRPTKSYKLARIPICCTQRHWTQSFRYSLLVLLSLRLFPK